MTGDTQDMGRTSGASPSALTQNEPGASDNRLTLDPNDTAFDFTKEWSDGEDYVLKNVRVRQLSSGEFEVLSAEEGDDAEDKTPAGRRGAMGESGEATEMGTSNEGGDGMRNPAIAKIMSKY
jgi:hypothetical protein